MKSLKRKTINKQNRAEKKARKKSLMTGMLKAIEEIRADLLGIKPLQPYK